MTRRNRHALPARRRKAGPHRNKGLRGSGKGQGRRHPKHRGSAPGRARE